MNRSLFKLACCVAWLAAAISGASRANAVAITMQSAEVGDFAVCTPHYRVAPNVICNFYVPYEQTIKFVAFEDPGNDSMEPVFVESLYSSGRKIVGSVQDPCFPWRVYELRD